METLAQMTWVACCKDAPTVAACRARRAILAIFLER
jgi:hypothetical protein